MEGVSPAGREELEVYLETLGPGRRASESQTEGYGYITGSRTGEDMLI